MVQYEQISSRCRDLRKNDPALGKTNAFQLVVIRFTCIFLVEDGQKKLPTSGACFVCRIILISPVHARNRLERAESQAEILVKTTSVYCRLFFH